MLAPIQSLSDDEPPQLVQNVDRLSDSEEPPAGCQLVPAELDEPIDRIAQAKPNKKRKPCPAPLDDTSLRQRLFRVASSMCPCSRSGKFRFRVTSCHRPFLNCLDDLVQLVSGLKKLDKQDADNRVAFSVFMGYVYVACTLNVRTLKLY